MHLRQTAPAPLLLLLAILGSLLLGCGPAPESGTSPATGGLAIVEPQHPAHANWVDLGDIPFGETVRYEVPLANLESGPLVIQSIQSGCSCTVPSIYYRTPEGELIHGRMSERGAVLTLPEGAVAMLLLEVDSRQSPTRNKPKLVVVRIVSDSPTAPFFSLDVRLRIDAPFVAVPSTIDLGRVAVNAGGRGATLVLTEGDELGRITGVRSTSEGVLATVDQTDQSGRRAWTVRVVIQPPIPIGYRELEVELATTGPGGEGEGRPLVIPVRINGVPDFELRPTRLLLQPPAEGQADLAEVTLVAHMPGLRFLIEDVRLAGERDADLDVSIEALQPDITGRSSRWILRVRALSDLGASGCSGTVTVTTDSVEIGTLEVPYIRLPPG